MILLNEGRSVRSVCLMFGVGLEITHLVTLFSAKLPFSFDLSVSLHIVQSQDASCFISKHSHVLRVILSMILTSHSLMPTVSCPDMITINFHP